MTIRNAFEACLIELNKVQAPSLLLDDFIYLFNKAIQQYVNKRYNLFETKQQLTDDLRVLTKTEVVKPVIETDAAVFGTSYRCPLPDDYVHILNCICEFQDEKENNCGNKEVFQQGANKLDTTQWPHVINNAYMKPSIRRPYYYIINIQDPGASTSLSNDDKVSGTRYGNSVQPIMQIKCGNDSRYTLQNVYIDYLRAPQYLTLSSDELDDIADNSSVIEFPDYVVYEIINQIVMLTMENGSNPRVQTNHQVNQTIA